MANLGSLLPNHRGISGREYQEIRRAVPYQMNVELFCSLVIDEIDVEVTKPDGTKIKLSGHQVGFPQPELLTKLMLLFG